MCSFDISDFIKCGVNVLGDPWRGWGKGRGLGHGLRASPVSYRLYFLVGIVFEEKKPI